MTALTYEGLIRELFPRLTGGVRWGIDRTERLLATVGDPQKRFRSVHVGGTNGKGSVSATVASVLNLAGQRVGLYTSPHLCTFRERIRIDQVPIEEDALVSAARRLWPVIQREEASFFEATTAIAFLAFAEAGVDVAVVEVGLGGRLDATNVITPEIVVLTNVALDHADYLGESLESIAFEKAGIIKAGVPVITAARDPSVIEIFRRRAADVGAPFHLVDPSGLADIDVGPGGTWFRMETEVWGDLTLHTPLIGAHQAGNTALAVRALELLTAGLRPGREAVVDGVSMVHWPGRLQWQRLGEEAWIFDAAHNPAGVEALTAAIRMLDVPRPIVVVAGILNDKDWKGMITPLLGLADRVILTIPPTAPEHRRWDPEQVVARLPAGSVEAVPAFTEALATARCAAFGGTAIVTGSFHTVGDALCVLGLAPYGCDLPLPGSPAVA